MPSIKTQDLYRVVITEAAGIAASGDVDFTVSVAPTRTNGFLVLSPENAVSREVVYFHNVIGNRIYVRGVNRRNPKLHPANDSVQMNDVEDIFNYYSDMVSPLFYMEKTGSLGVRIWGGTVLINRTQVTVADTNLTLTDNTTNYIVYDYLTNVVSVNTTGVGLVKVTVAVTSGIIGTPTYNVIKESYADPFVPDVTLVAPVIQNNTFAYADSTGSANAYAVSYTPAPTAYVAGQKFFFKANFQNTGAATLNVNGLGAKTIKKLDGATDLASTDIASGSLVEIMYDGTNFQLTSIPQTIKNTEVTQLTSVNLLTEKTAPVGGDFILVSDSEASFVNKKVKRSAIPFYYGDGSDGSVTVSTTISLTRDMQYSSLTVTGAGTINTRGYKIFVSGTLTNSGIIQIAHGNGGNAVGNTAGVAPATSDSGSLGNIQIGGTGAAGVQNTAGLSVTTPSSLFAPLTSQASNGGTGGGLGGNQGGTGVAGTNIKYLGDITHSQSLQLNQLFGIFTIPAIQYSRSSGGGGGGGGSLGQSGGGGSGGNGGGCIFISAKAIINNNFIQIIGGNGGNGGNSSSSANYSQSDSGGGGGGGGSGGIIFLLTASLTGTGQVISKGLNGGNGGNASTAGGSQAFTGGGGGFGGNGGIIVSPTGNTFTLTAGSGGTGGTGVNGGASGATGTNGVAGVVINY